MLIFKYAKTDGYQFVSHLDTLKHIQKSITRGEIPIEYSKGFNPHMLVFMSSPLGVGIKSIAEYCFIETPMDAAEFFEKYNSSCPGGLRAIFAKNVDKKPNLAACINGAEYVFKGVPDSLDVQKILSSDCFTVIDKKGEEKNIRDRIQNLRKENGDLVATLSFGAKTLRPDSFIKTLEKEYNFEVEDYFKVNSFCDGKLPEEVF